MKDPDGTSYTRNLTVEDLVKFAVYTMVMYAAICLLGLLLL